MAPLHNVYLKPTPAITKEFLLLSRQNWSHIVDVLFEIETKMEGPFALGDQISLADLHLIAWLARLMAISTQIEKEPDELIALEKALTHECLKNNVFASRGLGSKVRD